MKMPLSGERLAQYYASSLLLNRHLRHDCDDQRHNNQTNHNLSRRQRPARISPPPPPPSSSPRRWLDLVLVKWQWAWWRWWWHCHSLDKNHNDSDKKPPKHTGPSPARRLHGVHMSPLSTAQGPQITSSCPSSIYLIIRYSMFSYFFLSSF